MALLQFYLIGRFQISAIFPHYLFWFHLPYLYFEGPKWVAGKLGSALDFVSDSYMEVEDKPSLYLINSTIITDQLKWSNNRPKSYDIRKLLYIFRFWL